MARPPLPARLALLGVLTLALPIACGDDGDTSTTAASTAAGSTTSMAASTTEAAEGESTGTPAECDAVTCAEGELCVVPTCCDGPEPVCFALPASGDCGDATLDMGNNCCLNEPDPRECMMMQWCIPGPCTPDPPFCAAANTVLCDFGTALCTLDGVCSGPLQGGALVCEPCEL